MEGGEHQDFFISYKIDASDWPKWVNWQLRTTAVPQGHTDWVRSVGWSPDGNRLASASDDGSVRVWDVATGAVSLSMYVLGAAWLSTADNGRYKVSDISTRAFWWSVGWRRVELADADGIIGERVAIGDPL